MVQLNLKDFINTSNKDDARLVYNFFKDWDTKILIDAGDPDIDEDTLTTIYLDIIREFFAPQLQAPENELFHKCFALKHLTLHVINPQEGANQYAWIMHWELEQDIEGNPIPGITYLEQDDSQPKPMYTYYLGSLYISIIGLA